MNFARLLVVLTLLAAPAALAQGMLIPTDTSMGPLGVKYQHVSAELRDGTAVTRVEQTFVNSGPRQLEAHYVFPLPKGAALQDFYLWINGKKTKGEILEKQKATEIYEGIVRRLQDPGLLEYVDSDVFRARVFPVPANGEQKIELTFSQVLDFQSGVYHYHYPLGAGARGAPALKVRQDFSFAARLTSKTPIRSVYSPTHALGVSRKSENEAVAGMEAGSGFDISKDLDLYYTTSDKAIGLSVLSYRASGEEPGYFLALVSPRTEVPKDEIISKRVTFVVDTSGSMMGDRIKLARDSLKYCVQRLNPRDEFNVVRFSTDVEALFEKPQSANPDMVKKALSFVDSFEAIGGTAIDEALLRGLKDAEGKGDKPHMVIFITDGHPTVGSTEEDAISGNAKKSNKGSRVFTFGVGDDLNARLLDRIAEQGQGTSDFVRDGKEFEIKISAFMDKVANPVLSNVALDLAAFGAYDVYPKKLPDLFKGQQLVVMGRYRTPGEAKAVLSGSINGAKKSFEYGAAMSGQNKAADFIPRLWAIRKVGYLLEEIRLRGERAELKDEVTLLGKKFGIVTPYTSYLVVEDVPVANNRPPPPPPWAARPMRDEEARFAPQKKEKASDRGMVEPKPASPGASAPPPAAEPMEADDLAKAFGGGRGAAAQASGKADTGALGNSSGSEGIAVSKATRALKDYDKGPSSSEPVRVAGGRTYIFRAGGWFDSEAIGGTAKTLKVKYLSEAYFALLKARPELKAGLALGDRVVVLVGANKSVVIAPGEGEEKADKVEAFLK
ncbi:MAG: VWA domain-containing protein [Archangiaceae bacterium]|nr:VWA domain-containing protein [Archangiaceae bacterium]